MVKFDDVSVLYWRQLASSENAIVASNSLRIDVFVIDFEYFSILHLQYMVPNPNK